MVQVEAYNVKLRRKDRMNVSSIIRSSIKKGGVATGKYRYRLAGVGSDGTKMSKFISESDAKALSKKHNMSIKA